MKLIVAGSTGYVGTEVVRQALSIPAVTSVLALARRATPIPQNLGPAADTSKLKSVVCEDLGSYSESVKDDLSGADACIWVVAITPLRSKLKPWEEVRKICHDYTATGIETISRLPRSAAGKPLRFVYVSGFAVPRDSSKKSWMFGEYPVMRGQVECLVLDHAKESKGAVEACVAKPGIITTPGRTGMVMGAIQKVGRSILGVPEVDLSQMAATLIDQVTNGFEKETLENDDLIEIGRKVLLNRQQDC